MRVRPSPTGTHQATSRTFATAARDHALCAIGIHTHNLSGAAASQPDELHASLKAMMGLDYVREEEIPAIPVMPRPRAHALYGPLADFPVQPEVVLKRFSNRPCTTWGGRGTSAHTDAGGPMRAYSMDLRERALLDSDAGMKAADVAAKYRVSGSWVRLLKQRRRDTGEVAPRVQRHGRRGMREPHLHTLAALIAAHPDRTLAELKDALATPASVPTVWRAVRALGLTVKKNGPPVRTRSA